MKIPTFIPVQIAVWTRRIEFANRFKNMGIGLFAIAAYLKVFNLTGKLSVIFSLMLGTLFLFFAYLLDKTNLRNKVERIKEEKNDAWIELMSNIYEIKGRIDRIEEKLK